MNNIGQFPAELISLIVTHLDDNKKDLYTCTLVNKAFYNATIPFLWRDLVIDSATILSKITTTLATVPRSPLAEHIRHISLTFQVSDPSLLAISQHLPYLEHLRLENAIAITDTSFLHIPQHCPHLTMLYIKYAAHLNRSSMVALSLHCRQLGSVSLERCRGLLDAHTLTPLGDCPLQELALIRCQLNNNPGVEAIQHIAQVVGGFDQLHTLRIQDPSVNYTALTNMVWPHLTQISLDACLDLDDDSAIRFLQHHPHLTHLELQHGNLTDRTLAAIPMWLPRIQSIIVNHNRRLTATGICKLVKRCAPTLGPNPVWCDGCDIFTHDDDYPCIDLRYCAFDSDERGVELCYVNGNAFDPSNSDW